MAISAFSGGFAQFLLWERSSRDSLEVKRLYIDLAGDLVAGVVLSQIVYWHLPNREGKARLQVERKGVLWLAKGREEWWDECRISPKQADRALAILTERGLIEVRLFKFGMAPRKHIRILHDSFLRAWRDAVAAAPSTRAHGRRVASAFDDLAKTRSSTNGRKRLTLGGKIHDFPQGARSLDTEITTETTAARGPDSDAPRDVAADALAEELVAHGVSRGVARCLARQKPEACRRCLEYLPFASVKTTKGAWLANAIRDEYGPPPGFEAERARIANELEIEKRALTTMATQKHAQAMRDLKTARLAKAYCELQETQGEALRAFGEYVDEERARTDRMAMHLSPARRSELLSSFDTPEHRLELFERWMNCVLPFRGSQKAHDDDALRAPAAR